DHSGAMSQRSTIEPTIHRCHMRQYGLEPASISTTGTSADLPVCIKVRSSKVSSIVPNPPGKSATPLASLTRKSLRVKKYLNVMSLGSEAIQGLASCSNGRRMFSPKLFSPPALLGRAHDAGAGPGDDHPTHVGHALAEESRAGHRLLARGGA